jgi:YD repeat-containing protein
MQPGISRRSWLVCLFSGLAGLAGLRRRATAAPTAARPERTAPPFWPTVQSFAYDVPGSLVSVTTHTYDATGNLTAVDPPGRVTTYTYFYDAHNRLT